MLNLFVTSESILATEGLVVSANLAAHLLARSIMYGVLVTCQVVGPREDGVARLARGRVDAGASRRALQQRLGGRARDGVTTQRRAGAVDLAAVLGHLARGRKAARAAVHGAAVCTVVGLGVLGALQRLRVVVVVVVLVLVVVVVGFVRAGAAGLAARALFPCPLLVVGASGDRQTVAIARLGAVAGAVHVIFHHHIAMPAARRHAVVVAVAVVAVAVVAVAVVVVVVVVFVVVDVDQGRRSQLIKLRERTNYPQLTDVPSDLRVNGARHASHESLPPSKPAVVPVFHGSSASGWLSNSRRAMQGSESTSYNPD
jgi:hypothetical protein